MLKERPTKTATVSAVCIAVGLLGLISGCASPKTFINSHRRKISTSESPSRQETFSALKPAPS